MIKLAVNGACGKMGRRLVALGKESGVFEVAAALECAGHELLGQDIGRIAGMGDLGIPVTDTLKTAAEVLIDFSTPSATAQWADICGACKLPLVVGTTGLGEAEFKKLRGAAEQTAVLWGANMSLGMNVLFKLAGEVAAMLDDSYDIEVTETHHRFKRDAPSGSALELARWAAEAKQWPFPGCVQHGREGKQALRQAKTIGMHALRLGDTIGEHTVAFGSLGETLELRHSVHTRDTFVRGALRAAQWLIGQKPGLYGMADVLGL